MHYIWTLIMTEHSECLIHDLFELSNKKWLQLNNAEKRQLDRSCDLLTGLITILFYPSSSCDACCLHPIFLQLYFKPVVPFLPISFPCVLWHVVVTSYYTCPANFHFLLLLNQSKSTSFLSAFLSMRFTKWFFAEVYVSGT